MTLSQPLPKTRTLLHCCGDCEEQSRFLVANGSATRHLLQEREERREKTESLRAFPPIYSAEDLGRHLRPAHPRVSSRESFAPPAHSSVHTTARDVPFKFPLRSIRRGVPKARRPSRKRLPQDKSNATSRVPTSHVVLRTHARHTS